MEPESDGSAYRQRLLWHLSRVDAWIMNADTKATVILGLNGALVAALIAVDRLTASSILKANWFNASVALLFGSMLFTSVVVSSFALFPRLASGKRAPSLYHFELSTVYDLEGFQRAYRGITPEQDLVLLEQQVYINSSIAARKFRQLQVGVGALITSLASGTVLVLYSVAF